MERALTDLDHLNSPSYKDALGKVLDSFQDQFQSLLDALKKLHDEKYCHGDLNPGNIFVSKDARLKIGDLGEAGDASIYGASLESYIQKDIKRLGDTMQRFLNQNNDGLSEESARKFGELFTRMSDGEFETVDGVIELVKQL